MIQSARLKMLKWPLAQNFLLLLLEVVRHVHRVKVLVELIQPCYLSLTVGAGHDLKAYVLLLDRPLHCLLESLATATWLAICEDDHDYGLAARQVARHSECGLR